MDKPCPIRTRPAKITTKIVVVLHMTNTMLRRLEADTLMALIAPIITNRIKNKENRYTE
jgi:hypothetical protein